MIPSPAVLLARAFSAATTVFRIHVSSLETCGSWSGGGTIWPGPVYWRIWFATEPSRANDYLIKFSVPMNSWGSNRSSPRLVFLNWTASDIIPSKIWEEKWRPECRVTWTSPMTEKARHFRTVCSAIGRSWVGAQLKCFRRVQLIDEFVNQTREKTLCCVLSCPLCCGKYHFSELSWLWSRSS